MDLGLFVDDVLNVVDSMCSDGVVETHEQAADVLEALCRKPGASTAAVAAIFGLDSEQVARSRECHRSRTAADDGGASRKNERWASLCDADAVYTWNVLTERINQATHWREEYRDLVSAESDAEEEELASPSEILDDASSLPGSDLPMDLSDKVSKATRDKVKLLFLDRLDGPKAISLLLAQRLDTELYDRCPNEKEYRTAARSLTANFKRSPELAAAFAEGKIPPQWLILAHSDALAPRTRRFEREIHRKEAFREAQQDIDVAQTMSRMWQVARGGGLQNPAQSEDPTE